MDWTIQFYTLKSDLVLYRCIFSREGHATMVYEIADSLPRKPSVIALSVGGGGLLCGVLRGMHNVGWNDVPVVAVETEGANCLAASVEAGQLATIPAITRLGKCPS